MNAFDKYYTDILNEGSIRKLEPPKGSNITRRSLDPTVFQFPEDSPPIMQSFIRAQILEDLHGLNRVAQLDDFFVTGETLTPNYTSKSTIDVNIKLQYDTIDDIVLDSLFSYLKIVNGRLAGGTTHPIHYFILNDDYDVERFGAIYDIANETWVKEPMNFVGESITDYAHKTLDPKVWDISQDPPMLLDDVKETIVSILKNYFGPDYKMVDAIHITGSLGTQQWHKNTDMDIHILPKNIEKNKAKYQGIQRKIMNDFRDKDLRVSGHPFEVFLQLDPAQEMRGDASYDVLTDRWLKVPFSLSDNFDPDVEFAYLKKDLKQIFSGMDKALGELRRDLVDYDIIDEYLDNLKPEEKTFLSDKLKLKLIEIEKDIKILGGKKEKYHELRKNAYTPEDQENAWKQVLKSKSWAPNNVMWKILDRYKYISLIVKLQKILKTGDRETLEPTDVNKVKKVFSFNEHFEDPILNEYKGFPSLKKAKAVKPLKQPKVKFGTSKRWKDPLARHSMVAARGGDRQTMSQIPKKYQLSKFQRTLPFAERILDIAKKADFGIWKLTERQLLEIVEKYGLRVPDENKPTRKLGVTGIILWRRGRGDFLLVKRGKFVPARKKPKKLGVKRMFKPKFGLKGQVLA